AHDAGAGEDLPAAAEPTLTASAPSSYAVAGTGVIDIVPAAGQVPAEPEPIDRRQDDAEQEPGATAEESGGYAADDPWAPEDANPDVEALGEIDDELSTPEPADADDDRPWEHYVKTDSDVEADAFFAAFDADGNPRAVPDGEADAASASGADAEPEHPSDAGTGTGADADPTDLGPSAGSDPENSGDATPEDEPAPPDPSAEPDPEPWIPPEAAAFENADDEEAAATEPSEAATDDAAEPVAPTPDAASVPSEGDQERVADDDRESVDQEGGDR
ncbi:MAG TPA: hypothetical protein VIP82_11745, partial [Microbacterium sp.]